MLGITYFIQHVAQTPRADKERRLGLVASGPNFLCDENGSF